MITEGQYPFKQRGDFRTQMLAGLRWGLQQRLNPVTGVNFTPAEVTVATAPHSEYYIRADAVDSVCMLEQGRGEWLLAQLDPTTSGTGALDRLWGAIYELPRLPASGGSGGIGAPCPALTHWIGSTIIGDPAAYTCQDQYGNTYQVLFDLTSPADGSPAPLELLAVSTGYSTNLQVGEPLTWTFQPDTVTAQAVVTEAFTGGNPSESDGDYGKRILARIRHKPAAGNNAQQRAWIEDSSTNAVAVGFVYACARMAGTVFGAPLQKRGNVLGPLARLPSVGTLATATAYVVSPGSPVQPADPAVWIVGTNALPVDVVVSLALAAGSAAGWPDFEPWPVQAGGTAPQISGLTDQQHFVLDAPTSLPVGVTAPQMMVWNAALSLFEILQVTSVTFTGGTSYAVVLTQAPRTTLAVGSFLSPAAATEEVDVGQLGPISQAFNDYFDSLGSGEMVPANDPRAHRAFRFPKPQEEYPQRCGSGVLGFLSDALGGALADSNLESVSATTPPIPADPISGPTLLVAGRVCISPF